MSIRDIRVAGKEKRGYAVMQAREGVVGLFADKDRIPRVLKAGSRFATSDVVVHGDVPA